MNEQPDFIVVNRASGRMLTPTSAELRVRHFPPLLCDEPRERGGKDRAPTPLEYVLVALCA